MSWYPTAEAFSFSRRMQIAMAAIALICDQWEAERLSDKEAMLRVDQVVRDAAMGTYADLAGSLEESITREASGG